VFSACQKDTFKGSGRYKLNKSQKKTDDYLESEAGKVIEKSDKRNKKLEKKKLKAHEKSLEAEIEKTEKTKKKKKKNTGRFLFY